MRRHGLWLLFTLLCALSAPVSSVNLSTNGKGQVLIFPYYTVRNELATIYTVVNTADRLKAVSLRFLEGKGGVEVADLSLYLPAGDVWTGALVEFEGAPRLFSLDETCSVPAIPGDGMRLSNLGYSGDLYADDSLDRAREGMLLMIEMGTVDAMEGDPGQPALRLFRDCSALAANWQPGGVWFADPLDGIDNPAGGLRGTQTLIEVVGAYANTVPALALEDFRRSPLHIMPGTPLDLGDVDPPVSRILQGGELIESTWNEHPVQAVSAVLAAYRLSNEFSFDNVTNGLSEWVLSQPTRALHVSPSGEPTLPPFGDELAGPDGQCQRLQRAVRDREGQIHTDICFFKDAGGELKTSPCPVPKGACWATSIATGLLQDEVSAVFASPLFIERAPPVTSGIEAGWSESTFQEPHQMMVSDEGHAHYGIPLTGFSLTIHSNGVIDDQLRTYGIGTVHSIDQRIETMPTQ